MDLGFESLNYKLLKLPGGLALVSIEHSNMPGSDIQQAFEHRIELLDGAFDDDANSAILSVFNKTCDRIVSCQVVHGIPHTDALHPSA